MTEAFIQRSVRETKEVVRSTGRLRIPELILGFSLFVELAFPGLGVPVSQVGMILALAYAITRRPEIENRIPGWTIVVLTLGLFYVGMLSMFADPSEDAFDWTRRMIRMLLTVSMLAAVASGRLHLKSLICGLVIACVVNVPLHYLGITEDTYGGVLTGLAYDKNVAGLSYAVIGVLALSLTERVPLRLLTIASFGGALWLTGSRTSMGAFAAAVIWIFFAQKLPLLARWGLFGAIWYLIDFVEEDFSQVGVFSDREGSDLLRSRIDAASQLKVEDAGFWGMGLGEAYVPLQETTWLFHNSYWTALVEGGWPWLTVILAVTVGLGLRPFYGGMLTRFEMIAQAATIVLLVTSTRLGEVLFTLQWMLVIAFAIHARALAQREKEAGDVARQVHPDNAKQVLTIS